MSVVPDEILADGAEHDSVYSVVVHAMHEIVATCEAIEELAVGKRVSSDDAVHEGIVACDEVIPPRCMWSVVTNRVGVRMPFLRDICCKTMFADQDVSVTVRQAMFNIHVEIVLVENEDEFPNCAVVVFGDWDPVSVVTFCQKFDIAPPPFPCPAS